MFSVPRIPNSGGPRHGRIGGMTDCYSRGENDSRGDDSQMLQQYPVQQASEADGVLIQFLALLGPSVENALRARRMLLADLDQARRDPANAFVRVGRTSRRCVRAFHETLMRMKKATVPAEASECARELEAWLAAHVEACDLMSRAAAVQDGESLRKAVRCLCDGAPHAARFNDARVRLVRRLVASSVTTN